MTCFVSLLCGITYNGKAAKTHCGVERDDCAVITCLNNKCGDLCLFTGHGNRDLRPTSIAIALVGDHSDLSLDLSISHSHLDAVVALRVEFNSTFQRSPKTRRMYANRWSALVADQSDCNGGRPLGPEKQRMSLIQARSYSGV